MTLYIVRPFPYHMQYNWRLFEPVGVMFTVSTTYNSFQFTRTFNVNVYLTIKFFSWMLMKLIGFLKVRKSAFHILKVLRVIGGLDLRVAIILKPQSSKIMVK
jgi:hypothetical protein